ncbi:hypothetical protein [Chitinophaga nivalis]|uniref:Uncharacterized protein n=1 Tax=Chitinophaga nivalis TaxID=2991709 RepID=A0ABT3IIL6_9BACT|nr:hypothetical protein [Chitinophaga nivalis]MCW3466538.1 hypothetical protein [Chitinophaga nivalis]MCW3483771.1 hypothetical protein [Chitinophaga nivalis]
MVKNEFMQLENISGELLKEKFDELIAGAHGSSAGKKTIGIIEVPGAGLVKVGLFSDNYVTGSTLVIAPELETGHDGEI